MILMDISMKEGKLWLSAPGREPLLIDDKDLKYSDEKAVSIKMLDIFMKGIFVGKKYDEYFSDFLLGEKMGLL